MASSQPNPLEELTESLAPEYVALVQSLVKEFAPNRPWWTESLTQDQQLWRWMGTPEEPGPRVAIMGGVKMEGGPAPQDMKPVEVPGWLPRVVQYMPAETLQELIYNIYTSPAADKLIPIELIAEQPWELLEMVQAAGPEDASKHIAKMEKLYESYQEKLGILANSDSKALPRPPEAPPALPVQLGSYQGRAGDRFPFYGGVPQSPTSDFNPTQPSLSGQ